MRTVVALARCSHFAPTVAVTTFATVLALAAGRGAGAGWVAVAVLCGQLSVGWSNDWLDRDRDRAAGRTDKPIARGEVSADVVVRGAVVAAVLAVVLSLASGWQAAAVHVAALASAWSYNLGVKATVVSVLPYTVSFALLPAFVTLGLDPPVWPRAWAVLGGALLGAGAHFMNTLPDLDADAATGIRGLPHVLGPRVSLVTAAHLLAGGAVTVALGPPGPPGAVQVVALVLSLVGIGAAASVAVTDRARLAFPFTLLTAATIVVAFVAAGAELT